MFKLYNCTWYLATKLGRFGRSFMLTEPSLTTLHIKPWCFLQVACCNMMPTRVCHCNYTCWRIAGPFLTRQQCPRTLPATFSCQEHWTPPKAKELTHLYFSLAWIPLTPTTQTLPPAQCKGGGGTTGGMGWVKEVNGGKGNIRACFCLTNTLWVCVFHIKSPFRKWGNPTIFYLWD